MTDVMTAGGVQTAVAGKDAHLQLAVKGTAPDGTAATFELRKAADDSVIESLDGQVQKGKAQTVWTAVGPDETGAARSHRVYYVVTVEGNKTTSPELEVYHDTMEITSQDEQGATLSDVKFRLAIKVAGTNGWHEVEGSTGSSGTFVAQGLPLGDEVELTWGSPARLVEWVDETCKKRTAKLKNAFKVELVWPRAGDLHKQHVNLRAHPQQPERGSVLKVRVKVVDADGPSRRGDEVFLKLDYGENELSERQEPARGVKGGGVLPWSSPMVGATAKVKQDGGEAEFEVELGKAGGDKVTLRVGGTEACEDASVEVENWRKVQYSLVRPESVEAHPLERAEQKLAEVFVLFERIAEVVVTRAETAKLPGTEGWWFKAKELPNTPAADAEKEYLVLGTHNETFFCRKHGPVFKGPVLGLTLGHALYDGGAPEQGATQTFVSKVMSAVEEEVPLGSPELMAFPRALDDGKHPLVAGLWKTVGGSGPAREGQLGPESVIIEKAARSVKVRLPKVRSNDPGNLLGVDGAKIQVNLVLKVATGPFGGGAQKPFVYMSALPGAPQVWNDNLVHEVGHAMRQTAGSMNPPPRGLATSDHGHVYEARGHVGPHCNFGLDDAGATHVLKPKADGSGWEHVDLAGAASAEPDYRMLFKSAGSEMKQVFGTCIMYGAVPWEDPSQATAGICEKCLPFFLAQSVEELA